MVPCIPIFHFFFFNDTATTEIYTLSLHDALPILRAMIDDLLRERFDCLRDLGVKIVESLAQIALKTPDAQWSSSAIIDRKSTRLNSSHGYISYAVFCLKQKKQNTDQSPTSYDPPS